MYQAHCPTCYEPQSKCAYEPTPPSEAELREKIREIEQQREVA
jgi:hypothetical protein